MEKRFRLTRSTDFKRVRRHGKSYAHPLVVLIALPNELHQARIGVAAGRSVGGAVRRNRSKRLLRAAIAPLIPAINSGYDLLLLARKPILEANSAQVRQVLTQKLGRANLLINQNDR